MVYDKNFIFSSMECTFLKQCTLYTKDTFKKIGRYLHRSSKVIFVLPFPVSAPSESLSWTLKSNAVMLRYAILFEPGFFQLYIGKKREGGTL